MAYPPIPPKPVIEPGGDDLERGELTVHALHTRIRQQEILAELGVLALQGRPFLELLNETARLTADGMEAEFCKILEFLPGQNRLLVRAGVGWHEGVIGVASVGADLESPSGFALRTGKPVISNHLENGRTTLGVNTGQQQHRDKDDCRRRQRKIAKFDCNTARHDPASRKSLRHYSCTLNMGLHSRIYDSWARHSFKRLGPVRMSNFAQTTAVNGRSPHIERLAERDETLLAFVPQHQSHTAQALK